MTLAVSAGDGVGDTIPNSQLYASYSHHGAAVSAHAQPHTAHQSDNHILFRLEARNNAALRVMIALRDRIDAQVPNQRYEHQRQFLQPGDDVPVWQALGRREPSVMSSDESGISALEWTLVRPAYFEVTLETAPRFPKRGWSIGRDRSSTQDVELADLLLPTTRGDQVHSQQANFFLGEQGDLRLKAFATVKVDGHTVEPKSQYAILARQQTIQLGNLEFQLTIDRDRAQDADYMSALTNFSETHQLGLWVDQRIAATPVSDSGANPEGWVSSGIINIGHAATPEEGRTVVESVTNMKTGEHAARKVRKRLQTNSALDTDNEVTIYRKLGNAMDSSSQHGHEFVVKMKEAIFRSRNEEWQYRVPDIVEIYYVPLAAGDFKQILTTNPNFEREDRLRLIVQTLLGLRWLHENGWTHRDIKPSNLVIKMPERRVAIIDLEQAVLGPCESRQPCGGTIGYLAPEQENPRYCDPRLTSEGRPRFQHTIDVFALALVALEYLPLRQDGSEKIRSRRWLSNPFLGSVNGPAAQAFVLALNEMLSTKSEGLTSLLARMLLCSPRDRLTARQALEHPFIRKIAAEEENRVMKSGKMTSETGQKRVAQD